MLAADAPVSGALRGTLRAPLRWATAAVGAGALAVVAAVDPARSHRYPGCIFLSITGLECPGCGSTRAAHQLLNGHVLHAFDLNPLALIALPWLLWRLGNWLVGRTPSTRLADARWLYALAAVVITYGVLRNIPATPFTYLAASP